MNICTIIAKNYLPYARVLARSHAEHHPDSRCYVLVIDESEGYVDAAQEPFELLTIADIGLHEFDAMRAIYDILELSTAVKPWLLRHMLAEHDDGPGIAYLDPDILIMNPLVAIEDALREHPLVLTPHLTDPMPRDGKKPSETDILIAGVYNLGFIGLAGDPETDAFLDWWAERLLTDCHNAPAKGLFVDQRWVDFVPGLVPHLTILRDPTYNVAYWNLPHRDLRWEDGRGYTVDGALLRFFHFSGYDPEKPQQLSKHQNRIRLSESPALRRLCDLYGERLLGSGWEDCRDLPYENDLLPSGLRLSRRMRDLYREGLETEEVPADLFSRAGEAEFVAWLNEPAPEEAFVTRYLYSVWKDRLDLQRAYPYLADAEVADGLLGWAGVFGAHELSIPDALLPPRSIEHRDAVDGELPGAAKSDDGGPARGVNVVGYLRAELGIGEIARRMVSALDSVGLPAAPVAMHAPNSRPGHPYAALAPENAPFPVNLICVNADGVPGFAEEVGDAFFEGRYNIGLWWWETSEFPRDFDDAFSYVDEVWAGTSFVAKAISAVSPVPVVHIPMPVTMPQAAPLLPGELRWPDAFTFYFSYDYNSVVQRKNPLGVVDAYLAAFDAHEGAALVLKCINANRHAEAHSAVCEAIGDRPDIVLMEEYLDAGDKDRLTASCDCYVSLHRSEGLGLTIAEAMYLGKPVIATGYSGNMDYMDEHNSYPVDYRLVPIGEGADPYPPGGEWAEPDLEHCARLMRRVFTDPEEARRRGARAALDVHARSSSQASGLAVDQRLRRIGPRLPRENRPAVTPAANRSGRLVVQTRGPSAPVGSGPVRGVAWRGVRRLIRPFLSFQGDVNTALEADLRDVERHLSERVTELDRRVNQRLAEVTAASTGQLRAQEQEIQRLKEQLAVLRQTRAQSLPAAASEARGGAERSGP